MRDIPADVPKHLLKIKLLRSEKVNISLDLPLILMLINRFRQMMMFMHGLRKTLINTDLYCVIPLTKRKLQELISNFGIIVMLAKKRQRKYESREYVLKDILKNSL